MNAPQHVSFYDRLVDRYVDFTGWPTSKKVAFLTAVLVPYHVLVSLTAHLLLRRVAALVDLELYDKVAVGGFIAATALAAASALAARRRTEGRWTVYLLILVFGAWILILGYVFGITTSALLAWFPLVLILLALFFDERAAWWGFLYGITLISGTEFLELTGRIPYAPLLTARTVDAQLNVSWVATNHFYVLTVFLFCFSMAQFSVSARKVQQRRLEAAHAELAQTSEQLTRANDVISRYVASQLAEQIRAGNYDIVEQHARRKLTLFFSDIKDFTAIADRIEPEDLSRILNEYLSEMASIGERYGGTIDKFVGDAIMIFFGAPTATDDRDQAVRAVRMAVEMQQRLTDLRTKWLREGIEEPFLIRIGINTGQASVGNFGSKGRMDYTAIGRQVNLAARLQSHCEPGKILVSHSTFVLIQDEIACTPMGQIQVKGLEHPVRVYEVAERPAV